MKLHDARFRRDAKNGAPEASNCEFTLDAWAGT